MKKMDGPVALAAEQNGVPTNSSAEVPQIRVPDLERIRNARRGRMLQLKEWQQYDRKMTRESEKLQRKGLAQSTERNYFAPGRTVKFPQSLIFLEAAARGDLDEVRKLLSNGVCPDVANEDGLTALHQCCIDNVPEMCRLLLRFGANPNARDTEKWTPLHAAATCEHTELCGILIAHGADLLAMNADGNMPYECCQPGPTLSLIETEMDKRGITQEELDDLHRLPECQMLADMETLYKAGKDLNGLDSQGASLLHIAAACGYEEVTIFLLKHGAKIDLLDRDGWQAIHIAACWGHLEVIERLVNFGADIMAKTTSGESVFDICEDDEMHARLTEIKEEMERKQFQAQSPQNRSGKQRELVRRRSSNNPRTASIRRSSMREKKMMSWKEAKQEAEMRGVTTANLGNADEWSGGQDATKLNNTAPTKTETYPPSPALPKIRSPPRINSPASSDSAYSPPLTSPDQSGLSSNFGTSPSPDYNNSSRPDRLHPLPPLNTHGHTRQPNGATSPPNPRPTTNRQADKNKPEDLEPPSGSPTPLGSEQALRYSEFFARRPSDAPEAKQEVPTTSKSKGSFGFQPYFPAPYTPAKQVSNSDDEESLRTIISDENTATFTPPIKIFDAEDSSLDTLTLKDKHNGANATHPDSGPIASPSSDQQPSEILTIRIVTEPGANKPTDSLPTSTHPESLLARNEYSPVNIIVPPNSAQTNDTHRQPLVRGNAELSSPVFERGFERSSTLEGSPGSIRPERYTDFPVVPPRTIRITSTDRHGIISTSRNSPQYPKGRESTLSP
ncbi:unnamed protein product [Calicophoron daubneyi]|uniref:Protein phosphatase 1 regulatory subunit 16A n=1 Tax=Calicophoron daubneyi TaxID=300641 RepID=A0AAV2T4K9_CALDB